MAELIVTAALMAGALGAIWDSARTLRAAFTWDRHVDDAMRIADFDRWEREMAGKL